MPTTGYEDIDSLNKQTSQLYDDQMKQQENIINTGTQQAIDEIERNKQKLQEETDKTNKALYTDYQKQINPYGVEAENMAEQGLGGSGVSESSRTNYYNTYQNARSEATNNANTIKADFDAKIAQARQNGNMQLAQSAIDMYKQKINDLYQTYNLRYQANRDNVADNQWQQQFDYNKSVNDRNYNYQVGRDNVADSQWRQEFDYNKLINDRNYNYQVGRDKVTDSQWQKEFDYNKYNTDRNYNYQVNRDKVADSQWKQEFDYNKYNTDRNYNYTKSVNDRNYNYQVGRDKVSDSQWQQEYNLSKKTLRVVAQKVIVTR